MSEQDVDEKQKPISIFEYRDDAMLLVAALVSRFGGDVTVTKEEVAAMYGLVIREDFLDGAIRFRVISPAEVPQ